ncbi:hypothetical protein Nocox_27615 [Nonomuraea coxensis DSM 45129]|uniref:Integral membrane protein n=1 Tax=Nonomuraea coxensis DSM 45129 TaxID=1122611 RepID=A0ABX8U8D3_9ACTN|nr:hypothetical protein [Nonomuraea coxensis]QYC43119.1 hypothetical protein Nocox_27615 [Nonomuraea coxensis DSM 45129]
MVLRTSALRLGKRLIRSACLSLPVELATDYYREWTAELPAILDDRDVRRPAVRIVRALAYAADQHRSVRKLAPRGARSRSSRGVVLTLTAIAFLAGVLCGGIAGLATVLATGAGYFAGIFVGMVADSTVVGVAGAVLLGVGAGGYLAGAGIVIIGELIDTTTDEIVIRVALGGALVGAVGVSALVMTLGHGPIGLISLCVCGAGIIPATRRLAIAYRAAYAEHYRALSLEEDV